MRTAGLSGYVKRRKGTTTIRVPGVRVADDLVGRDFNPQAPNRLWTSDIKYVSTWEGTLYLASVIDCYSRLVVDALEMAVARRRPESGLIHHSDQGSQYVALVFGRRLREAGIAQSMGSKGDCYDNAVCESFHATKQEAKTAIFDWIEAWYNRERRHSRLGYRSPADYERDHDERSDCARDDDRENLIEEKARAA